MTGTHRILVINPGSTSTKVSLFLDAAPDWAETIAYPFETLAAFKSVTDQLPLRLKDLNGALRLHGLDPASLSAVAARGGPFRPLEGGTYAVTRRVTDDVLAGRVQFEHASLLGVCMAERLVRGTSVPAFFTDPVSVDEFQPLARVSGLPELERKSLVHALNVKAVARLAAAELKKDLARLRLVVAHLGGGITVAALREGRIVDANNAVEGGPFSPERAGSVPVSSLVRLCYSGEFTEAEMRAKLVGRGGLVALLGTNDARDVEKRIAGGDTRADRVYRAMAYQVSKEIGAMAAVLNFTLDGIVLTGGLARSALLTGWIREQVHALSTVFVLPGEREMEALALGALRVLTGVEPVKTYPDGP